MPALADPFAPTAEEMARLKRAALEKLAASAQGGRRPCVSASPCGPFLAKVLFWHFWGLALVGPASRGPFYWSSCLFCVCDSVRPAMFL